MTLTCLITIIIIKTEGNQKCFGFSVKKDHVSFVLINLSSKKVICVSYPWIPKIIRVNFVMITREPKCVITTLIIETATNC